MYETKEIKFKNTNNFLKKYRKLLPKIENKNLRFKINLLNFRGSIDILDNGMLCFKADGAHLGVVAVYDIFELEVYVENSNNEIEKCYNFINEVNYAN